jgi:flavin reductase (DIM6/NTAB) family NADH-FMN oxidoreductase RutF
MTGEVADEQAHAGRFIISEQVTPRDRYQLLTSLIVPRPIAWVSTRSSSGVANLAPFSYFAAIASSPFLIGISIGSRRGLVKDSLRNIRETGVFCVNVVTERQINAMNESSGEHPPDVDEFTVAGLTAAEGELVAAPYVSDCPAVLECRLQQEVPLDEVGNVFIIAEVVGVRLHPDLEIAPGTHLVDPNSLRPVARLGADYYSLLGELPELSRPVLL